MKLRSAIAMGAGGAALAYLYDPQLGRTRRARLTGMLAGRARRRVKGAAGTVGARVEHLADSATGMVRELRPQQPPENDQTLADKVRSEVLGRERWRGHRVNVSAHEGVVTLHGRLDHPEDINAVVEEVGRVTGVHEVVSNLHLPGTPAPNKQAARQARVT